MPKFLNRWWRWRIPASWSAARDAQGAIAIVKIARYAYDSEDMSREPLSSGDAVRLSNVQEIQVDSTRNAK